MSDADLNALLSNLGAAGNTAYSLVQAPVDTDGVDGDVAVALLSATELAGYRKASGTWSQVWAFSGRGGGTLDQMARDAAAAAQADVTAHVVGCRPPPRSRRGWSMIARYKDIEVLCGF